MTKEEAIFYIEKHKHKLGKLILSNEYFEGPTLIIDIEVYVEDITNSYGAKFSVLTKNEITSIIFYTFSTTVRMDDIFNEIKVC